MKYCIICTNFGHTREDCPFDNPNPPPVAAMLTMHIILTALVCAIGVGFTLWLSYPLWYNFEHGPVTWVYVFLFWFNTTTVTLTAGSITIFLYRKRFWRRWYAHWKYRHVDPNLCCCGCEMGTGDSICFHGGCKSAKAYAIEKDSE